MNNAFYDIEIYVGKVCNKRIRVPYKDLLILSGCFDKYLLPVQKGLTEVSFVAKLVHSYDDPIFKPYQLMNDLYNTLNQLIQDYFLLPDFVQEEFSFQELSDLRFRVFNKVIKNLL